MAGLMSEPEIGPRDNEPTEKSGKYDLEDYECGYYKELNKDSGKIRITEALFECPSCSSRGYKREYALKELLHHAARLSKSSANISLREQATHLALGRYLKKYVVGLDGMNGEVTPPRGILTSARVNCLFGPQLVWSQTSRLSSKKADMLLKAEPNSGMSSRPRDLTLLGCSTPLWNHFGHTGFSIVEFSKDRVGFRDAMAFDAYILGKIAGESDYRVYEKRGNKLFGGMAQEEGRLPFWQSNFPLPKG
ncbi:hypothetical protein MLD38_003563 [Melastoma candidum]|uniref:Uncharacterized protein n=1 Tax=Melastoma candidum TaxID=119954 RepID=A0ACB9S3N6_9MYRT|nr:hypothetical protein MLD38_003563 [Melastoma candidum]